MLGNPQHLMHLKHLKFSKHFNPSSQSSGSTPHRNGWIHFNVWNILYVGLPWGSLWAPFFEMLGTHQHLKHLNPSSHSSGSQPHRNDQMDFNVSMLGSPGAPFRLHFLKMLGTPPTLKAFKHLKNSKPLKHLNTAIPVGAPLESLDWFKCFECCAPFRLHF